MAEPAKLSFSPTNLWLTLLPLTVIAAAGALMQSLGPPAAEFGLPPIKDFVPAAFVHAEVAARIKALAAWLLLIAISFSCIAYFLFNLRHFNRGSVRLLLGSYIAFSLLGSMFIVFGLGGMGERMMGEPTLCSSLRLLEPAKAELRCPGDVEGGSVRCVARAREGWFAKVADFRRLWPRDKGAPQCRQVPRFEMLRGLNLAQRLLLPWTSSALVLGAISCLAVPAGRRRARCGELAQRLNTYLYLTAAMLVCGLLSLSALLHWPGYAFVDTTAAMYKAHVSARVLYWGVTYSIFVASCYVLVATRLAKSSGGAVILGRSSGGKAGPGVPQTVLGPKDLLTVAAAIFAPAIVGLTGDVLKL